MPFRLAVLDLHAADAVREAFPAVERWYIGGHSHGGAFAAIELSKHPDAYAGLVLLGAYSIAVLSASSVRVLSVYGSEDGILDREKYVQNKPNLPADSREIVLEGGCHAYFGMYGPQRGDGIPSIDCAEQIRRTASVITDWFGGEESVLP